MVSNPFFGLGIVVWGGRGRRRGHGQREDDCLNRLHSVNGTVFMTEALVVAVVVLVGWPAAAGSLSLFTETNKKACAWLREFCS